MYWPPLMSMLSPVIQPAPGELLNAERHLLRGRDEQRRETYRVGADLDARLQPLVQTADLWGTAGLALLMGVAGGWVAEAIATTRWLTWLQDWWLSSVLIWSRGIAAFALLHLRGHYHQAQADHRPDK